MHTYIHTHTQVDGKNVFKLKLADVRHLMMGRTSDDLLVSVRRVPKSGGEHELHKYAIKLACMEPVEVCICYDVYVHMCSCISQRSFEYIHINKRIHTRAYIHANAQAKGFALVLRKRLRDHSYIHT
jgi:hypothetical protein